MKTEFKDKVKSVVNKYGFEYALTMFGDKEIIRLAYGDNPSEFLYQFNDLTIVEKDDKLIYMDKDRLPLFYYPNKENGYVYINYDRIWKFFSDVIGFKYSEIQTIINNWLEEAYNIRGLTPKSTISLFLFQLEEAYNINWI